MTIEIPKDFKLGLIIQTNQKNAKHKFLNRFYFTCPNVDGFKLAMAYFNGLGKRFKMMYIEIWLRY